jgi:chromosome segregation ATPase
MAFTVEDLTDLIAILEQRPEWRERLRQILLTKELLELPQLVERIARAVDRLVQEAEENRQWRQQATQWMEDMTQWRQWATQELEENRQWRQWATQELEENRQWRQRTEKWMEDMTQWRQRTEQWMEDMTQWRGRVDNDLAYLKGSDRERYYRDKATALFGRIVEQGRDPTEEVIKRLRDAFKAGQITREEFDSLTEADVLWMGEYKGVSVLLVCEASFTIGREDIERAIERAQIARKVGYKAVPIVAGVSIPDELVKHAYAYNVIVMTDGKFDYEHAEKVLEQAIA